MWGNVKKNGSLVGFKTPNLINSKPTVLSLHHEDSVNIGRDRIRTSGGFLHPGELATHCIKPNSATRP